MNYPPFSLVKMDLNVLVGGWDKKERKQYKYDVVVVILLLLLLYIEMIQYRVVFLLCVCVCVCVCVCNMKYTEENKIFYYNKERKERNEEMI